MNNLNNNIKVSVCIVAYNHEKYIRQCLQSIVDQKTDFAFEVIVGDDGSVDGTKSIIEEFVAKYPNIVKAIFHETNRGGSYNYMSVHQNACGEYIAHLDGDDYALPGKLQIQTDYLDKNSNCNIVWHRVYVLNDKTGIMAEDLMDLKKLPKQIFDRNDILALITIGVNSSKMYRSSHSNYTKPSFPMLDYFANVEEVGDGFAAFCSDKPLGIYRTGIGISSSGNFTKVLLKKTFDYFIKKYPQNKSAISCAVFILFLAAAKNKNWVNCKLFLGTCIRTFSFYTLVKLWANRLILPMLRIPPTVREE